MWRVLGSIDIISKSILHGKEICSHVRRHHCSNAIIHARHEILELAGEWKGVYVVYNR